MTRWLTQRCAEIERAQFFAQGQKAKRLTKIIRKTESRDRTTNAPGGDGDDDAHLPNLHEQVIEVRLGYVRAEAVGPVHVAERGDGGVDQQRQRHHLRSMAITRCQRQAKTK